jgi:molecular chaperone DnaJ
MYKINSLFLKNGSSSRLLKNSKIQTNSNNSKTYNNSINSDLIRLNYSTLVVQSKILNCCNIRKNKKFNYLPFRNFSFFKRTITKNRNRNYNFYEVLGIDKKCTNEQIRASYLKLAKQYHPDVNKDPGSDDKFKTLTLAYEALSNQRNRDLYDAYMDNDPYSQEWKYKEEMWKEDEGNSAKNFYNERAKYDKYSQEYKHQSDSNFWQGNREDFTNQFYKDFDNIFTGGAGAPGYNKPKKDQKGEDILLEIKINLEESYFGTEKGIKFSKVDKCKTCHGHRSAPGHRPSKCFTCNGIGEIKTSMFNSKKCNQCKGVGVIIKHPCK